MTLCRCFVEPSALPTSTPGGELHVLLYGGGAPRASAVGIGAQVKDLFLRFGVQPSVRVVDLVSIALAVTAADTFVLRDDADDAWSRTIKISVPLVNPAAWEPLERDLSRTLSFLTGDTWSFEFISGGIEPPPLAAVRQHQRSVDLSKGDSVALFSGGLDSTIAAFEAIADKRSPILVSHAYSGDQSVQYSIARKLPAHLQHVSVNAWPNASGLESEISMRSRSFLFLSIAALVCDVRSRLSGGRIVDLVVPENGLIALNAPLTPRRLGSHSTRTTHPHYLASVQALFDRAGISAAIQNPYEPATKGEMVRRVNQNDVFRSLASETVSCGKWKREGRQCGRCVPCLIRRASLYAGDIDDLTDYQSADLTGVLALEDTRDDLVGMLSAVKRLDTNRLDTWVAKSGPLPLDPARRSTLVDVHRRGILEVKRFLNDSGLRT